VDLMVDIETLGQHHDAHILSIGAVLFDPYSLESYDGLEIEDIFTPSHKFYQLVTGNTQRRRIEASTVLWWMKTSDEARKEINGEKHVDLNLALAYLCRFYKDNQGKHIWSYGSMFDQVILNDAMDQYNMVNPFHYQSNMCMRTLAAIPKKLGKEIVKPIIKGIVEHNPLHDAIRQAVWAQQIFAALRS